MTIKKKMAALILIIMTLTALVLGGCGSLSSNTSTADPLNAAGSNASSALEGKNSQGKTASKAVPDTKAASGKKGKDASIDKGGSYTSKEEVALYIHTYGTLPDNYITKKEAEKLGWDSSKGNLWDVAPGKSIGGSHFGNYDGKLPEAKGVTYKECDINYDGSYRGPERIIYSNDGHVYYTNDHYNTFTEL